MGWTTYNRGQSLGTAGSEGGIIRRDEEHDLGACITLEEGGSTAPWSITCGVYGWMFHTRFLGSLAEGDCEFDRMKAGLDDVLAILAREDDESPDRAAAVSSAIEAFVNRFP
jgi:hypothetical protein